MKKIALLALILTAASCGHYPAREVPDPSDMQFRLPEIAQMLSELPVGKEHLEEVHAAVRSSSANGYDEEYTMRDLFVNPGAGVGDSDVQTRASSYGHPMRSLIEDYLKSRAAVKSEEMTDPEAYIEALTSSDVQIYWPFSDLWDGESAPVVTFDPGTESSANTGYEMVIAPDGTRSVRKVTVTEQMARERPVWVVNTNDDSSYTSLELFMRDNPQWGGGGSVTVGTKAEGEHEVKSLVLKDFTMRRHYDSWFRGASEFFIRTGSVEGFTASTEAEMRLYSPSITDFMVVVKRNRLGEAIPFNAILVSDWTDQLESLAFLVTEDDGGTRTSWKTEAVVKVNSKSYGVVVELPFNVRDDIVWRGSLSNRFMSQYSGKKAHFGDVDITFEIQ